MTPDPLTPMTLDNIAAEARKINQANGWDCLEMIDWPGLGARPGEDDAVGVRRILSLLALVHSEVAEATEAVRRPDLINFAEELADTIIRTLDIAAGLRVDISTAVRSKLAANRRRGHKHGGKQI